MFQLGIISYYPCFFSIFASCLLVLLHHTCICAFYGFKDLDYSLPGVKKKEMFSYLINIIIAFPLMKCFIFLEEYKQHSLFELLGIKQSGFLNASVISLFLTIIFCLGPICMDTLPTLGQRCCMPNIFSIDFMAEVIIFPLFEEFFYRSCMMRLLLQCYDVTTVILITSLIFGYSHLPFSVNEMKEGNNPFKNCSMISFFHFSFCSIVGAYFGFLFFKTGHIVAPFLAHTFINVLGPDLEQVFYSRNYSKLIIFVAGLILGCCLLTPLTNPVLYSNNIFLN